MCAHQFFTTSSLSLEFQNHRSSAEEEEEKNGHQFESSEIQWLVGIFCIQILISSEYYSRTVNHKWTGNGRNANNKLSQKWSKISLLLCTSPKAKRSSPSIGNLLTSSHKHTFFLFILIFFSFFFYFFPIFSFSTFQLILL